MQSQKERYYENHEGFSIPYRKLARQEAEPTTSC